MNLAPGYTLDAVEAIVTHPDVHIRGLVLTLKLADWSHADRLAGVCGAGARVGVPRRADAATLERWTGGVPRRAAAKGAAEAKPQAEVTRQERFAPEASGLQPAGRSAAIRPTQHSQARTSEPNSGLKSKLPSALRQFAGFR